MSSNRYKLKSPHFSWIISKDLNSLDLKKIICRFSDSDQTTVEMFQSTAAEGRIWLCWWQHPVWLNTTSCYIGAQVAVPAVIAPGHPETRQKDLRHLSTISIVNTSHSASESHDQILPGSDAVGIPHDTFGTVDCHADIAVQKRCEKRKNIWIWVGPSHL